MKTQITVIAVIWCMFLTGFKQVESPNNVNESEANGVDTYMSQYLTYELPDGLFNGTYSEEIGFGGGNLFLLDNKQVQCTDSAPVEWCATGGVMFVDNKLMKFENGLLDSVALGWNHSIFLSNAERIEDCEAQAVIIEAEHDLYTAAEIDKAKANGNPIPENEQTAKMWYVFFAKEDGNVAYALFLNEKYFDKEDMIELAKTVHFQDGAFYKD